LRLRVGVSSCLLGERVRYDGDHARHDPLVDAFGPFVEWVRVCPEMELGLGVPREPISLLRVPGRSGPGLWTRDTRRDLTGAMREWAEERRETLADLDGYVLKERSPSCGLTGARVYETKEALFGDGPFDRSGRGLWAAALAERFPDLPLVEEPALDGAGGRRAFARALVAERRRRRPGDAGALADLERALLARVG
jgi:uncharacterized protein YbbK (DUF523 family)